MISALVIAAAAAPHIDLYTMGQGRHPFERFGHAAVCVVHDADPAQSRCYNYGTTAFDDPLTLSLDFLRGRARFWVSVWTPERMLKVYVGADRTVWRQRLPLTPEQARAFQLRLEHDTLEANRYYIYHHFYDNCTTRVRDILDEVTGGRLSAHGARPLGATYRELGAAGLADYTVVRAASDFTVGRPADAPIDVYRGMFLPRILRDEVTDVYGAAPEVVYTRQGPPFPQTGSTGRHLTALLAAVVLAPVVVGEWWPRAGRLLLGFTAAALGLLATLLWGLAVLSSVPELRWNEALLLFWPSDFVLPLLSPEGLRRYARLRLVGVVVVSALTAVGVLWQPLFGPILLPLAVFGVLAWPPHPPVRGSVPRGATGRDASI